jgi:hypothetical protein
MIVIAAVLPNVILRQQYLFPSRWNHLFFIFWQHVTYYSNKYSFLTAFKLRFKKEICKRNKQVAQFLIEAAAYQRFALIGGWRTIFRGQSLQSSGASRTLP